MLNVSGGFLEAIKQPSRQFDAQCWIGVARLATKENIVDFNIESSVGNGDVLSLGNVCSRKLSIKFIKGYPIPDYFTTQEMKPSLGLLVGSAYEYVNLGVFYPDYDSVEKTRTTVSVEAYDGMYRLDKFNYSTSLTFPAPMSSVLNEISTKYSVTIKEIDTANIWVNTKPQGTVRAVISILAQLLGANAVFNGDGELEFVSYQSVDFAIDDNNIIDFKLTSDDKITYNKLVCVKTTKNDAGEDITTTIEYGEDDTHNSIIFANDNITTQDELQKAYDLSGLPVEYVPCELKIQGIPQIECGDIITLTNLNVEYSIPIITHKLSYNGGLVSNIVCKVPDSKEGGYTAYSGNSISGGADSGLYADVAVLKKLVAGNITADNIKANSITAQCLDTEYATIENLSATNAEIETLKANKASVEDLNAVKADIKTLNTDKANVTDLNAQIARIDDLDANKADITDLTAAHITFTNGEGTELTLEELLTQFLSAGSTQTLHLTASNAVIDEAVIKSLVSQYISVSDLKAGTINTDEVKIQNTDGSLSIIGSIMQFKDSNNNVRLQLGKDAEGNFTFVIVGEDGKTCLYDETGVHEGAIADDLIVRRMIGEKAVGKDELDYQSFVEGYNADTNTYYINTSKLIYDPTGQNFSVAFGSLQNKVDNIRVGDENLLANSGLTRNIDRWTDSGSIDTSIIENRVLITETGEIVLTDGTENNEIIVNGTGATASLDFDNEVFHVDLTDFTGLYFDIYQEIDVIGGSEYIQSLDIVNTIGDKARIDLIAAEKKADGTDTTPYKDNAATITKEVPYRVFTTGADTGKLRVLFRFYAGADYYVKYAQLREGNQYVLWAKNARETFSNLTTSLTVQQGQIQGLITNTTVTKEDGSTVQLKDEFSTLKQTVDTLSSSIGSQTTDYDALSGRVTAVETKANTLEQTLTTTTSTISDIQSDLENCATKTQLSEVQQTATSLTTRITDVENNKLNTTEFETKFQQTAKGFDFEIGDSTQADTHVLIDKQGITVDGGSMILKNSQGAGVFSLTPEGGLVIANYATKNDVSGTITSTVNEYCQSDSNTTCEGCEWSETVPQWTEGKYIWQRVKYIYLDTNKEPTYSNAVCISGISGNQGEQGEQGEPGQDGKDGEDGRGITSIDVMYIVTDNKDTAPVQADTGWSTVIPAWEYGKYLWVMSKITYNTGDIEYTTPRLDNLWESITVVNSTVETHTSQISNLGDSIDTLVQDTSITDEEGNTIKLKQAYTNTKQTVDSLSNTVAQNTENIDKNAEQITAVSTKANTLEQSLTTTTSKISSLEQTFSKNLLNLCDCQDGYVADDGTFTEDQSKMLSDYIELPESRTMTLQIWNPDKISIVWDVTYYDKDKVFISTSYNPQTTTNNYFSTVIGPLNDTNIVYVRVSWTTGARVQAMLSNGTTIYSYQPAKDDLHETLSEVTQDLDSVNFNFKSTGKPNLFSNSKFYNFSTQGWELYNCSVYTQNKTHQLYKGEGSINLYLTDGKSNAYISQTLTGNKLPQMNTEYTLSLQTLSESKINAFNLTITYYGEGGGITSKKKYELKLGDYTADNKRYNYVFTTPSTSFAKAEVEFSFECAYADEDTTGNKAIVIKLPCLSESPSGIYTDRTSEVVGGNTVINADGVEVHNGALSIYNNNDEKVFYGDTNGNLSLEGEIKADTGYIGNWWINNRVLVNYRAEDHLFTNPDTGKQEHSDYSKVDTGTNGSATQAGDFLTCKNNEQWVFYVLIDGTTYSKYVRTDKLVVTNTGNKSCAVDTEDYDTTLMYSLETPAPAFEDYGEGQLDSEGNCRIYIEDKFAETIDEYSLPTIFLTKYGQGDVWVEHREHDYFDVKGTANLEFSWRVIVSQKNCGAIRMEQCEIGDKE